jgi:cyclophilin family peptidyl-prolyl cis-trans isomerase
MAPKKYRQKVKQHKEEQQKPKPLKKKKGNSNKSLYIAIGVIAAIVIVIGALAASGLMGGNGGTTNPTTSPSPSPTTIPSSDDPYANSTFVFFHTSMGNFTVSLRNDMPITAENFINLVNQGAYDGSTFHRVIENFMIQGGKLANGSSVPSIQDEFTDTNHNYNMTIAMANTGAKNSGTSQFFINTANNNLGQAADGTPFDNNYIAFGKIVYGDDVVMAISHVATDSNDKPEQTVTIFDARVLNI